MIDSGGNVKPVIMNGRQVYMIDIRVQDAHIAREEDLLKGLMI